MTDKAQHLSPEQGAGQMRPDSPSPVTSEAGSQRAKKKYAAPTLVCYGRVKDLVQAGTQHGSETTNPRDHML
jgi:hypothetical protein